MEFFKLMLWLTSYFLFKFVLFLVPLLLTIAFFTLLERKFMAAIQRRIGPNIIGFFGLLQPLADGLKLFLKESIIPTRANIFLFLLAPIWLFVISCLSWVPISFSYNLTLSELNLGIMYILSISSLGVYSIIIAGWASNSKYAFLGALRSAAQMISYEISLGILILTVALGSESLKLGEIVLYQRSLWYILPFFPVFIIFFISIVAETNRPPFDLPEAEAELVSGFNIEYSAMGFALFFLGETASLLLMSTLTVLLFFGGWTVPFFQMNLLGSSIVFGIKVIFVSIGFIWIRATFPRFRYDQLMYLGWKVFLPLSLSYYILMAFILR